MTRYAMHRRYGTVYRYDDRRVYFWSDYTRKWVPTPGDGSRIEQAIRSRTCRVLSVGELTKEQKA